MTMAAGTVILCVRVQRQSREFRPRRIWRRGRADLRRRALSFMRRRYSRDSDGVDGDPRHSLLTRLSPTAPAAASGRRRSAAPRRSSTGSAHPFHQDPFEVLKVVDWGVAPDYAAGGLAHDCIHAQASDILASKISSWLGGDHSVTHPLLVAHAEKHGPLAIVHFLTPIRTPGRRRRGGLAALTDHGASCGASSMGDHASCLIQIGIRTYSRATAGSIVWGWEIETRGIPRRGRADLRPGRGGESLRPSTSTVSTRPSPSAGHWDAAGRRRVHLARGAVHPARFGWVDFVGGDVVEVALLPTITLTHPRSPERRWRRPARARGEK